MNAKLNAVIDHVGDEHKGKIQKGSRHYLEVSIGEQAEMLGHTELREKYNNTFAIVPLKAPQQGMKVRIRSGELRGSNQSIHLYIIRPCGVKYILKNV